MDHGEWAFLEDRIAPPPSHYLAAGDGWTQAPFTRTDKLCPAVVHLGDSPTIHHNHSAPLKMPLPRLEMVWLLVSLLLLPSVTPYS